MHTSPRYVLGIWTVLLISINAFTQTSPDLFANSYGVVVGISKYPPPRLNPLPYADGDARAVAGVLNTQGYKVTELYDQSATRRNILAAFYDIAGKLRPNDRVLVFLALHGASKQIGGQTRGYIIPYDGVDYPTYISNSDLMEASSQMDTARHQLFILDACYGGLMTTRSGVPPDTPNYVQEVTNRTARQIVSAGGANQEVLDSGPNNHSVFASALLEALAGQADLNRDGYITYAELLSYLIPRASNAYQTPAAGVLPGHGGGEYVFRSPLGAVALAPTPNPTPKIIVKRSDTGEVANAKRLLQLSKFAEALPLFRDSAVSGNSEAMFYMAWIYEMGWGVGRDDIEAQRWYEKAAAAGNGFGMYSLGNLYYHGQGVPQNYSVAKGWYEKAAAVGEPNAMVSLGSLYVLSQGVPQDYSVAKGWYEKAAAAGNGFGMRELGNLYYYGQGVPQDYSVARGWYERAAAAGDEEAKRRLNK